MSGHEYTIAANVAKTHRFLRMGSKAMVIFGCGDGGERFMWRGISRSGRVVKTWAPSSYFTNFRAAWVPPDGDGIKSRDAAEEMSKALNERYGE